MIHEREAVPHERKYAGLAIDDVEADGTFSGYASVFGRVDLAGDVVEPGAFTRALAQRGAGGVRMLFQHDPGQPIGSWLSLREDARGLAVRGRLSSGVARAREVAELMRSGALDGLSIGFRTVRATRDRQRGVRRIVEADLWEISVVTFPMLPEARVTTIKGETDRGLPTTRQFERWLTRDAQLSRSQARIVIAKGFNALLRGRDAAPAAAMSIAQRMRMAAQTIKTKDDNQ